jgi:AmiR/NasT family two-component response regulator
MGEIGGNAKRNEHHAATMRLWLVDEKSALGAGSGLEAVLRQLEERSGNGLRLIGTSPFQTDFSEAMRKLVPDLLDMLVINERVWPEGACTQDLLSLGLGLLFVASAEGAERFRWLAEEHPIGFVAPAPSAEAMWLALLSSFGVQQRQLQWKIQVSRLQRRLSDRIVIERAKGILVQRLKISEEEAYKRLRVLSRRQRRQIRDIAQSLLDTQFLFLPDSDGIAPFAGEKLVQEPENQMPQS